MEGSANIPSSKDLISSAIERLPLSEKVEMLEELISLILSDAPDDPAVSSSLDLLDMGHSTLVERLEEIEAVYGKGWE
jgi:hypothetical protein